MSSPPASICSSRVERRGKVTILTFAADTVRNVENVIARELLAGLSGCSWENHLLLNFTHVTYLSSVELGSLVSLHKRIREAGGQLHLFNLSPQLLELFAITRLDTLLQICTEAEAAEFGKP